MPRRGRPPLGEMGRPVPEALVSVRDGRGEARQARGHFVTRSGRAVNCRSTSSRASSTSAAFAMQALKKAMKWDEEVFGLELDLDHYMIVAVGDFNMGAMENKGLNIFNTKYVLARARHRDRHRFPEHRPRGRPRVLPQLDRQPRHLPRLVPALAQGRAHRLPRPGIRRRHVFAAGAAHPGSARRCAPRSFPRTPARWRIRCGRSRTWRSATSTPPPCTRRARRSCA